MVISERDSRAIKLGGGGLLLIVLYFGIIEPVWQWHDSKVAEYNATTARIVRFLAKETKAEQYKPQVTEWESLVGPLSDPKPYSEQITAVSERIMSAAGSSGVELKETTPTAPSLWADDPNLQMASIVIDAEAEWDKVFKFVRALYQTEGVLSVEHMELSGKGGKLKIAMTISVLVKTPQNSESLWAS